MTFGELRELHERVQARFRDALDLYGVRYEALGVRYDKVMYRKLKSEIEALGADLEGLAEASAERLIYVARRGATSVAVADPWGAVAYAAMQSQESNTRPRVQPIELVSSLKQRGITVTADSNGNLNVTPAGMLGEADRSVLVANKVAIVAALAVPAEVI